jgi:hypothetical protein
MAYHLLALRGRDLDLERVLRFVLSSSRISVKSPSQRPFLKARFSSGSSLALCGSEPRAYSYRSASAGAIAVALLAGYSVAMKLMNIAATAIQTPSCQRDSNGT